jgi:hypothetical protein
MCQYRERASSGEPEEPPASHTTPHEANAPAFMTLAAQYGLDEDDMSIGDLNNGSKQTVEQEYQAYITAPISKPNTDILKFWEASGYLTFQELKRITLCYS